MWISLRVLISDSESGKKNSKSDVCILHLNFLSHDKYPLQNTQVIKTLISGNGHAAHLSLAQRSICTTTFLSPQSSNQCVFPSLIRMTAESQCSWSQRSVSTSWTRSIRLTPCWTWSGGIRPARRSSPWWHPSVTHSWSSIASWCRKSGTNTQNCLFQDNLQGFEKQCTRFFIV